jgi:hypothetical protein
MLSFCGIDVSKDRLDVIVVPEEQCCSVSNNRTGWADLVERLRGRSIAGIGALDAPDTIRWHTLQQLGHLKLMMDRRSPCDLLANYELE